VLASALIDHQPPRRRARFRTKAPAVSPRRTQLPRGIAIVRTSHAPATASRGRTQLAGRSPWTVWRTGCAEIEASRYPRVGGVMFAIGAATSTGGPQHRRYRDA
jgi:hypothetical protein